MSRRGELKKLMHLLRLDDEQQNLTSPADAIFMSIDLEVSRYERAGFLSNGRIPHIKELGIAILDTRYIFIPKPRPFLGSRHIATHQFSTSNASSDFEDCDCTNFRECGFAETFRISQDQVASTLNRYLRVGDDAYDALPNELRQIVLVGHSINTDWKILQAKGVQARNAAPITAVLDTHSLSHAVFSTTVSKPPNFALWGILRHLECPYLKHELHNAGNDATFTLHVLLRLALKYVESQKRVSEKVAESREMIELFANREINQTSRWIPTRRALGAYAVEDGYRSH